MNWIWKHIRMTSNMHDQMGNSDYVDFYTFQMKNPGNSGNWHEISRWRRRILTCNIQMAVAHLDMQYPDDGGGTWQEIIQMTAAELWTWFILMTAAEIGMKYPDDGGGVWHKKSRWRRRNIWHVLSWWRRRNLKWIILTSAELNMKHPDDGGGPWNKISRWRRRNLT